MSASSSFYVAVGGSDSGDGSITDPFATLARAQAAMEASSSIRTTTIEGGTYTLTKTLSLTAADSGETWQAAPGAKVVLSAGQAVTGWTSLGNGVWAAKTANPGLDVFVNGTRYLPSDQGYDPNNPTITGWRQVSSSQVDNSTVLYVNAADLTAAVKVGQTIETVDAYRYASIVSTITAVNTTNNTITVASPATDNGLDAGTSWRVLGAPSDLTLNNTFAYNLATGQLEIKTGSTTAPTNVTVPRLSTLINGNGANNVTLSGLTFTQGITIPGFREGGGPATVFLSNSSNDTLIGNTFTNTGNAAVFSGVSGGAISNNLVTTTSGNGFTVVNGNGKISIEGNTLLNIGSMAIGSVGISVQQSPANVIENNYIDGDPNGGIYVRYGSPEAPTNIIDNTVLDTDFETDDFGAIYTWAVPTATAGTYDDVGMLISGNRIAGTSWMTRASNGAYETGTGAGIYVDSNHKDVTVSDNVSGSNMVATGGTGVVFTNNTLVLRSRLAFVPKGQTSSQYTDTVSVAGTYTLSLLPGDIQFDKKTSTVTIEASSVAYKGTFASFTVAADGKQIGSGTTTATLADYTFMTALTPGIVHTITLTFTNGASTSGTGPSLNVYAFSVNGLLFQPSDAGSAAFSMGGGPNAISDFTVTHNIIYAQDSQHNFLEAGDELTPDPNPGVVNDNDIYNAPTSYFSAQNYPNGINLNSITTNPDFVDAATGDYRLASNSPAASIGFNPANLPLDANLPSTDPAYISAMLDRLEPQARAGALAGFALTSATTTTTSPTASGSTAAIPTLTATGSQIATDRAALAAITSSYTIDTGSQGARIGMASLFASGFTAPSTHLARISFIDGTDTFTATDPAAVVTRLYQVALGRTPDQAGLAGWIGVLQSGVAGAEAAVATALVTSAEFVAAYGPLTDTQFVTAVYKTTLGRAPDATGLAAWTNALSNGLARSAVVIGFSDSAEYIADQAASLAKGIFSEDPAAPGMALLYDTAFGRAPDAAGLAGWDQAVDAGLPMSTVAAGFLSSAEGMARFTAASNGQFVTDLYQTTLHRAPDAAGATGWTGLLDTGGLSRAQVLLDFALSPEHQTNISAQVYGTGTGVVGVVLAN